jgi:uncharacterized protein YndB with AHSA1/START domain
MSEETVSVTLRVAATPEAVFDVLTRPATHPAIDGTGWLTEARETEPITAAGQVFRMRMYHPNHPDGNYEMANRVEVLDPPRAITWKPGQDVAGSDELQFGGWTYGYTLVPADDGGTDVTLTYDWSAVPAAIREYISFPPFAPDHLQNSLRNLAGLATG